MTWLNLTRNCYLSESSDDDDDDKDNEEEKEKDTGPKSYYLRQNKPRTQLYNAPIEGLYRSSPLVYECRIKIVGLPYDQYGTTVTCTQPKLNSVLLLDMLRTFVLGPQCTLLVLIQNNVQLKTWIYQSRIYT